MPFRGDMPRTPGWRWPEHHSRRFRDGSAGRLPARTMFDNEHVNLYVISEIL